MDIYVQACYCYESFVFITGMLHMAACAWRHKTTTIYMHGVNSCIQLLLFNSADLPARKRSKQMNPYCLCA